MICADCQKIVDNRVGFGGCVTTDEKLLTLNRSAIYQVTSSERSAFDPAAVLMKLKGRTNDATIERVITCLNTHATELKIARLPAGMYEARS